MSQAQWDLRADVRARARYYHGLLLALCKDKGRWRSGAPCYLKVEAQARIEDIETMDPLACSELIVILEVVREIAIEDPANEYCWVIVQMGRYASTVLSAGYHDATRAGMLMGVERRLLAEYLEDLRCLVQSMLE